MQNLPSSQAKKICRMAQIRALYKIRNADTRIKKYNPRTWEIIVSLKHSCN